MVSLLEERRVDCYIRLRDVMPLKTLWHTTKVDVIVLWNSVQRTIIVTDAEQKVE
jgi:hypothetical protein